jgi:exodeoxyribonuclease VII large subunit
MPTVSAVGHEVDIAITDFVADLRAPTPSAAAEAVIPSVASQRDTLRILGQRFARTAQRRQQRAQQRLDATRQRLRLAVLRSADRRRHRLATLAGRLEALSPLGVLARGYSVARTPEGATLSVCADFSEQQRFELWIRDGIVDATVQGVRRREL